MISLLVALSAPAQSTSDPLAGLRDYLAELSTVEATFRQQVINSDGDVVEEAAGSVQLKKPGRFRWEYNEPYAREVVADGERVWVYESDLEQVTVRRLGAGLGETPAALLTGDTAALDQFEYVTSFSAENLDWITLRPKASDADFASISLGFAGSDLEALYLEDRLGQSTRLVLADVRNGGPIADEAFAFVVPEGADVIGESEL